mgnify:CR=1 FL=1
MSETTPISWADSTCNPTMGCTGCELWNEDRKTCYAGSQHVKYGQARQGYSPTFEKITFWPGRVESTAKLPDLRGFRRHEKPWLDGSRRLIFLSDMGDSLCSPVPFEWLRGGQPTGRTATTSSVPRLPA